MNIVINGLNLSTAQSVLLIAPDSLSDEELFQLKSILEYEFDNCKFVLLQGDFQAVVSQNNEQYAIEG